MSRRFASLSRDYRVCAALTGLLAFLVYLRTLAPTVMWYDMGELTTTSYVLGIAHNTGYPLYILLGKLFTFLPVGDVAYRVNLMSAVFAALTVATVFLIVHELTKSRFAALVGALVLAFSSTFWANANWAESYSLNAFSTALITLLLLRWRESGKPWQLYLVFLASGSAWGTTASFCCWRRASWPSSGREGRRWTGGDCFAAGWSSCWDCPSTSTCRFGRRSTLR